MDKKDIIFVVKKRVNLSRHLTYMDNTLQIYHQVKYDNMCKLDTFLRLFLSYMNILVRCLDPLQVSCHDRQGLGREQTDCALR